MANEIVISLSVTVTNGFFKDQFAPGQVLVDQAAVGKGGYVQLIGITEEVVNFGDVATEGYLILRNLDDLNYIEYGPTSGGAMVLFGRLKPGELGIMRLSPDVVVRAISIAGDTSTASPALLDVRLYEN